MTRADEERVQFCSHEITTNDIGEEKITGTVKNISKDKADAALVVNFFDSNKENISTKVVILRDIEPSKIKRFSFVLKPHIGDMVRTYTFNIGDIVE